MERRGSGFSHRSPESKRIVLGLVAAVVLATAIAAGATVYWSGPAGILGFAAVRQADHDGPDITVLAREPSAPDPPQIVTGFAVELGWARSFSALSARFAEIAANNAELPFESLEPRATIRDTEAGLRAVLLVGPFAESESAARACRNIALPGRIQCRVAPFEGAPIARDWQ